MDFTTPVETPGGEADAERYTTFVEAVTGNRLTAMNHKGGRTRLKATRRHLDGFMRYVELKDLIEEWLSRRKRQ